MELDKAELEGYKYVNPSLAKMIMRIRLRDIALIKEIKKLHAETFIAIDKYYKELDYWIVYQSMKDFQPDDFTIDDVRKMRYVHAMSLKILQMSSAGSRSILNVIESSEGRRLGRMIFDFNVPLTDEAWKMTPLQYQFCEMVDHGVKKIYTVDEFEDMIHGSSLPEVLKRLVSK